LSVDFASLHNVLKHPIRQRIVLFLLEKKELAYMDLMNLVEITNTGKLNYHLKILGDLIEKNEDGKYHLTQKGQLASQFLLRFPEKIEPTSLHVADAVLMGFAGFLLTLLNPGFWGFVLWGLLGIIVPITGLVYAVFVPGGIMWLLTVRRAHSHDPYDLFKPPLVTFAIIVLALIVMRVFNITITASYITSSTASSETMVQASLAMFLLLGLAFSFVGVGLTEIIHRALAKIRS
jgi:hypothetical protein